MGTRHIIAVFEDGKYKVAQYGQWDGYPGGQGEDVLDFLLQEGNVARLKEGLKKVRFLDREGKDKAFLEEYNKNTPEWSSEPDNRTPEQKHWWQTYMSRDLGATILSNVAYSEEEEIILRNSIDFVGESLHCEWAYVVDLDNNTFEAFEGFNKEPLREGERFIDFGIKTPVADIPQYYQVKHVKSWPLDNLPTKEEFLAVFKSDEDEDEDD
jgi:hypothetical protein